MRSKSCKPLNIAAEGSSASETTWGTIDVHAGALKANPTPMKKTQTKMREGLSRCSHPSTAKANGGGGQPKIDGAY